MGGFSCLSQWIPHTDGLLVVLSDYLPPSVECLANKHIEIKEYEYQYVYVYIYIYILIKIHNDILHM